MMPSPPRELVLVGGGHAHALVIRAFGERPPANTRVTLVSPLPWSPYSGRLPGHVAGHYRLDEVQVDLARLAAWAGVRFIQDEAVGIDRGRRRLSLRHAADIPYDRLSLNVGATPRLDVPGAADQVVALKPIQCFTDRWQQMLERVGRPGSAGRLRIAVVGAGAAGVEIALSMQYRLQTRAQFTLFSGAGGLLPGHGAAARRLVSTVLDERDIRVQVGAVICAVAPGRLQTTDGSTFDADEVIWATEAVGAPWLRQTGLALDAAGFVRIDDRLCSVTDPAIFAAGDAASLVGQRLAKSGVVAVRQAQPLAENLRRSLSGAPLLAWRPQTFWLALISTGNREAIASYGRLALRGRWLWHLKDRIDRRFLDRFAALPLPSVPRSPADPPTPGVPQAGGHQDGD